MRGAAAFTRSAPNCRDVGSLLNWTGPPSGPIGNLAASCVEGPSTRGGDRLNHAKFADNPMLVQLLGDRRRTPAGLASDEPPAQLDNLGQGLGKAVGSVAEIVITTPFRVLTVATGG